MTANKREQNARVCVFTIPKHSHLFCPPTKTNRSSIVGEKWKGGGGTKWKQNERGGKLTCIQQRKILIFGRKKKKKIIMLHLHFRAYLDILSAQVAIIKLPKKRETTAT